MPSFNHGLLRRVRLDLGLTQERAASALGVDVRTFRRYESGAVNGGDFQVRQPARRRLLRRMCEEFGVADEADWLLNATDSLPEAPKSLHEATERPAPPDRCVEGPAATPEAPQPAGGGAGPRYAHPLQPARHFVGRAELLAALGAWHRSASPTPRVAALIGVGGSGKTAIVERFLRGAAFEGGGAFVWSFYDSAQTEALLAQALAHFAGESAGGEGGRLERLIAALGAGPRHLLVFDGLEALQSGGEGGRALGEIVDPSLRRLVRAIAAGLGGARLLLTSRLRPADLEPWEGASVMTLAPGELSPAEARALLRAWGLGGDDGSLEALSARVGGHALSVAVLGSYGAAFLSGDAGRAGELVLREAARDDARARRLAGVLGAYARALEPLERDALARLSVLEGGVGLGQFVELGAAGGEVAGALAGAPEASIARALGRLERLGLAYRAGDAPARFAAHPFVRGFFKGLVEAPAERVHDALREALAARLEGRLGARDAGPAALDELEALFAHTLEAGRAAEAWAVYARGLGGFDRLGLRLGAMGRGARLLRRFARDASPERLRPELPPPLAAAATYDWGLFAGALGDLDLARRCYEAQGRAVEAIGGDAPSSLAATGRRTLAYTHWLRGDLDRAAALLGASLAIAGGGPGGAFHAARGLALLASIEHDRGRPGEALGCLERAREVDPRPVARRAFWEAELRLALGQAAPGEALARQGLAYCEARGWPGHVAHGHVLLGEAALGAGDPSGARAHLERARPWALESGEVEMALRCHQLAARICLAQGDAGGASLHAGRGLELADLYGFRLFAARLRLLAAEADRHAGDVAAGERRARGALALAEACGYVWGKGDALHALGVVLVGRDRAGACEALGEALTLRRRLGHPGEAETGAVLARLGA